MSKVRAIFAVLTVVTLFGAAAIVCSAGGGGGKDKWEYMVTDGRNPNVEKWNELGKDGWELFMYEKMTGDCIFKRRLP